MPNVGVSVVIGTHGRPELLRNGLKSIAAQKPVPGFDLLEVVVVNDGCVESVSEVCAEFPTLVRELPKHYRREIHGYSNPALTYNMGIKAAKGELVIMQGGEILWPKDNLFAALLEPQRKGNYKMVTMSQCEKIGEADGSHTLCAPDVVCIYYFFGASFWKKYVVELGGFEESYETWGNEDEDLSRVMRQHGVETVYLGTKCVTHHQWHPHVSMAAQINPRDKARYAERFELIKKGHLSNEGREWGLDKGVEQ
jgi:glycosyltransferase involved in cell wall biosynthesis